MSSESSDRGLRCACSLTRLMDLELNILSAFVDFIRFALPKKRTGNACGQIHSHLEVATLGGIFDFNLAVGVRHGCAQVL